MRKEIVKYNRYQVAGIIEADNKSMKSHRDYFKKLSKQVKTPKMKLSKLVKIRFIFEYYFNF
jgi:hypothetical protein